MVLRVQIWKEVEAQAKSAAVSIHNTHLSMFPELLSISPCLQKTKAPSAKDTSAGENAKDVNES